MMLGKIPASRLRLIESIARAARRAAPKPVARHVEAFVRQYYRGVGEEDLRARDVAARAASALAHLGEGLVHRAGRPLVRVFNPDPARDGFSSTHTVVMLVVDDSPFLVDSMSIALNRSGLATQLIVHPVLPVRRDGRGRLLEIAGEIGAGTRLESWQFYEIDRETDPAKLEALEAAIRVTLDDVRVAVADWQEMRRRSRELASELETGSLPLPSGEALECKALLEWMEDNHFTFLGYRHYRLERGRASDRLMPDADTGLGILRQRRGAGRRGSATTLTGEIREHARRAELLVITKANAVSTVHRGAYLDYVGVKTFDAKGEVNGEHRFLGLWSSTAYSQSPRDVPVLRQKVQKVIAHFGLMPASHDGRAVLHAFETYPRDELFQASTNDLIRIVRGVVNLYDRQQVRLFVRRDAFHRFYSCLLFVPRDRYNTDVRHRIEAVVLDAFGGTAIESNVQISESALARVHLIVRTPTGNAEVDPTAIEKRIALATLTWADGFRDALKQSNDEASALRLHARYATALPAAYQADTTAAAATVDVAMLEELARDPAGLHLRLYRPDGASATQVRVKLYRRGQPMAISDVLPTLENLGLRLISERPYELAIDGGAEWIQDFELEHARGVAIDLPTDGPRLKDAIVALWTGKAENDGFNRLVLASDLTWRETAVLRAYARWIVQTGNAFSQAYMETVLATNAKTAGRLARLFVALFDPSLAPKRRDAEAARFRRAIDADLAGVARLDEDRILRAFRAAIDATLRTNYFQLGRTEPYKPYLSLKLDPAKIPGLPEPRPMFEIWVYSPRSEGVHLRKGKVARGGLRWSDRYEDFRTEVLGLMKAQNVKNTLIVPVGAKGGFVCRKLPANREEVQREVVSCYQDFIRGLLDVTDNIVDGKVAPPERTVRRDADDTYLVVAADKGTATFSDIANAISREYGFWLDDAFASGGSAGYDHKKIAITARGGWECVKRHFREIGVDTQKQEFTVAGVGDMSGDVFGNGMLRSKHIRLVAAFDHRHIFIDPAPNAATSFRERERMFALPRSSWADYDRKLLSKGGGVWSRADKSLKLTPEARALLGIAQDAVAPNDVVKAILKLPVDLLWNGGIGTYVKAADETHAQVGDRANDAVRVDGRELRCKVVGEGGNLGCTQRGRVEYAMHGGRLNTDFIDNSAGVNCSDVEVNIKILLSLAERRRGLKRPARDTLLAKMTDDVAALVLRNNYLQSQAISAVESRARDRLGEHAFAIRTLERGGDLDRALEFLPSEDALTERAQQGQGLSRPEISVLLSYSKIWLYNQLIASDVPEDAYLSNELERYFPAAVRDRYGELLKAHPLKREIVATATTNSLVNRMGPVFALRCHEDTGAGLGQVARAFAIAREATNMRDVWAEIEALDNRVAAGVQYEMVDETARVLRHGTYWVLAHRAGDLDVERAVERLRPGLAELVAAAPKLVEGMLGAQVEQKRHRLVEAHVPEPLAARVAALRLLQSGLDIVDVAATRRVPILQAGRAYLRLGTLLDLDWLRLQIEALQVTGQWQSIARSTLRDNLYQLHRSLTDAILERSRRGDAARAVDAWLQANAQAVEHLRRTFADMTNAPSTDFATLSVALQSVRRLAGQ